VTVKPRSVGLARPNATRNTARARAAPRLVELLLVIMALVGGLQAVVMIGVELSRYLNRSSEVASLSRDVAQLELDIAALHEVLARHNDERFREQLARQQGFVYPNEILYRMLR